MKNNNQKRLLNLLLIFCLSIPLIISLFSIVTYKEIIECDMIKDSCTHTAVTIFFKHKKRLQEKPSEIKKIKVEQQSIYKPTYYKYEYSLYSVGEKGYTERILLYSYLQEKNAYNDAIAISKLLKSGKSEFKFVHFGFARTDNKY